MDGGEKLFVGHVDLIQNSMGLFLGPVYVRPPSFSEI